MRIAIEKAKEIYNQYGNDLFRISEAFDLTIIEEELKGRLKEVYFGDSIVIRKDLSEEEKRELIAHALGHHLMHAGNHLSMQNRVYSFGNYHERQANVFAAYLLITTKELENNLYPEIMPSDLAQKFEVTEKFIEFRLKLRSYFERAMENKNQLSYLS